MGQYYGEAQVRQVLDGVDIAEVVGTYVALKPQGKEFLGLCPFHDDRRPSMHVSPAKQIFKCFACGAGGDAIKFVMLRERMTFPEALGVLAERAGVELRAERGGIGGDEGGGGAGKEELERVNRWAARWFRGQLEAPEGGERARRYVAQRGIEEGTARRFGIGWAPAGWENLVGAAREEGVSEALLRQVGLVVVRDSTGGGGCYDRFRERLMFPVLDALGRVIAFGGRTLAEDPAKYLNSPESVLFDKSRAMYGIHAAKDVIVKERTAIVVEGYTDCVLAHQAGLGNVVATLGTALTPEHGRALRRYADRAILVFDSDEAGRKAAERGIEVFFDAGLEVRLATVPGEKDPADYLLAQGREAFEAVLAGAEDALEYKWRVVRDRLEGEDTLAGKGRAAEEFVGFVVRACGAGRLDEIGQGMVLGRVSQMTGVAMEQLYERVRRQRRGRTVGSGGCGARQYKVGMPAADGMVNAEREVLEVLLNRPELLAGVREVLVRPEDFEEEMHREVAGLIWRAVEQESSRTVEQSPQATTLGAMLASCEDPGVCAAATDLAARGEERGNDEATLGAALLYIERKREERSRRELAAQAGAAGAEFGVGAETALLHDVHARLRAAKVRRDGE